MIFIITFLLTFFSNGLQEIRGLYKIAPSSEKATRQLIEKAAMNKGTIEYDAYRGAATMVLAKHSLNPISKLEYFNRGKSILEAAIARDTFKLESRFLRYSIQKNAPSVLGYSTMIERDQSFLMANVDRCSDAELKGMISSYLKTGK